VDRRGTLYNILCKCPALSWDRMKNFGSAWMEPKDISRVSVGKFMALALRTELF
jgi:hypothetical protein